MRSLHESGEDVNSSIGRQAHQRRSFHRAQDCKQLGGHSTRTTYSYWHRRRLGAVVFVEFNADDNRRHFKCCGAGAFRTRTNRIDQFMRGARAALYIIAQAADAALAAADDDEERAVPLLLRGAALGRLGFYADSMASLQAAIELEGKLRHDTYVPPFALYELGALYCAQDQAEEAKKVFEKCAAVSYDFNFEVRAT